jgi:hypothetical protein
MRSKSTAMLVLAGILSWMSGARADDLALGFRMIPAEVGALVFRMTPAEVEALTEPVFTKRELDAGGQRVLFISRDFGSGRELRDAYLYRFAGDSWLLIAFRRTSSPKLDVGVSGADLHVTAKDGAVVISIPTDSISR